METFHIFEVKRLPYTLTKPSRTKIISQRYAQAITLSDNDEKFNKCNGTTDRAVVELKERGFEIVGMAEGIRSTYILSTTFKPF